MRSLLPTLAGTMKFDLQELRLPEVTRRRLPGGARMWRLGECSVIVSRDKVDLVFPARWHLSVSHRSRYPTWEEIGEARDRLIPKDVFMCMPFPPREHWLSYEPNCFHLWEFRDDNLEAQMKYEGEAAREAGYGVTQPESTG